MLYGHLSALFCIVVWSTTYISTKVLLEVLSPLQILVIRFVIGVALLYVIYPKRMKFQGKNELYFLGCGFFGVFLYYMCDNFALTYTMASNIGVIMSTAPFFTAIAMKMFYRDEEKLGRFFYLGFVLAMVGISLISFNGSKLSVNPFGDLLGILGAASWAMYSVFLKKVNALGTNTIANTRRINSYGLLFMIPMFLYLNHGQIPFRAMLEPKVAANLIFLSLIASAICFVAWNWASIKIGIMATSIYIYLGPVITVVASYFLIHEPLTKMTITGTLLTLIGLFLSEKK